MRILNILAAAVVLSSPTAASESQGAASLYPTMCVGALKHAVLAQLPKSVVAQCEDVACTDEDLENRISAAPDYLQEEMREYKVYVLDGLITDRLLEKEATTWAAANAGSENNVSGNRLVEDYVASQVPKPEVTEDDTRRFYEKHKAMFEGSSYEQVKDVVKAFVLDEKMQIAQTAFKHDAGLRHSIRVSADWMQTQSEKWARNPAEQCRLSGLPAVVIFSVEGCCDQMKPAADELSERFGQHLRVAFIDIRKREVLAEAYGVFGIPLVILYDKHGKELSRHTDNLTAAEVVSEFQRHGITLETRSSNQ